MLKYNLQETRHNSANWDVHQNLINYKVELNMKFNGILCIRYRITVLRNLCKHTLIYIQNKTDK